MELVEVILQGVRGSPRLSRWVFPAGPWPVAAGEAEALVARAAFELLAVNLDGELRAAALPAGEGGAHARVGLVFDARARRHRLLCDLSSGRWALQVQTGEAWETLSAAAPEIANLLPQTLGVPGGDALREVLFSFVDDLPSRRRARTDGAGARPARSAVAYVPGYDTHTRQGWDRRPDAALRARLVELQALAKTQEALVALEFELGGLQQDLFQLDAQLRPLREAGEQVVELKALLARHDNLDELATTFPARVASVRQAEAALARQLRLLDEGERRILDGARDLPSPAYARRRPVLALLGREPLLVHGLLVGTGAILFAMVASLWSDALRSVALLDIPAFALAAVGAFRALAVLEDGDAVRGRLERIAGERARERGLFAQERASLDRTITQAGFGPGQEDEVERLLAAHVERRERLRFAEDQLRAAEVTLDGAGLREQRLATEGRIRALEQRLATEGAAFDAAAVEHARERAEIEALLVARATTSAASAVDVGGDDLVGVDVGQRIVRAAAELVGSPLDATSAQLAPRASQVAGALTSHRFTAVRLGARAEVAVVEAATDAVVPFPRLSAIDRDLVALALRLAALEAAARHERLPLVLDRALDHLPAEVMPLLSRALQFIGQSTQVICLTTRRELAGVGAMITASVDA